MGAMSVLTAGDVAIGTYRWHRGRWRRWSGRRWAKACYSPFPERLERHRDWASYPALSDLKRERLLGIAVDIEVLAGATVVHRSGAGVVLGQPARVNHGGHFLLTLLTGGLWGFVWIATCLTRRELRFRLEVDPWGNIWPVAAP
jgi:hypothetical protein